MIQSKNPWRRTAWLLILAAVGVWSGVLWRSRRPADPSVAPRASAPAAAATPAPRALRLEKVDGAVAPRALAEARAPLSGGQPSSPIASKSIAPLDDSAAAHETAKVEDRTPAGAGKIIALSREELLKERDGVFGFSSKGYGATIGKGGYDASKAKRGIFYAMEKRVLREFIDKFRPSLKQ